VGLLLGSSAGILFGVLIGRVRWLGSALLPSFNAFRQVTLIAWIPLLTLWLGQGEEAKQTFIALAAFVPMALAAFEGTRAVSAANKELSAVFSATRSAQLRWLVLPSALPHLFSGLELSLVYGWLATIGAEYFFKVAPGVGNAMIDGREHLRMDLVLSAVVVVGILGFALNRVVVLLRSRLLSWANQ
jgi:sulfonate transport system permease protein